ncbi:MAG: hypothetical protein IT201_06905 [Thermoleophilia bacterium]|nr:hypothetical protein [Thermoleophilia bacterium]
MCRLWIAIAAALALALPAPASAEAGLIAVGRSIGPVALGMTSADVVAAIGQPLRIDRYDWPAGQPGTTSVYRKHGGLFRVSYAADVVVGVETAARFYRTASGVGPGTPYAAARAAPGFRLDACTGGFRRRAHGAFTFLVPFAQGGMIRRVVILQLGYFDC